MALSSICDDLIISFPLFQDAFDAVADEDYMEYSENGRWPFQQFVDQLIHDMFDPSKFIIQLPNLSPFVLLIQPFNWVLHCSLGSSSWHHYGFEGNFDTSRCLCWSIFP